MNITNFKRRSVIAAFVGLSWAMGSASVAWAAEDYYFQYGTDTSNTFDIESGMWAFEGEVNGKPGRGLQVDEQSGDLVIVTYFGYRPDGSALFMQASGPRTHNVLEAEMIEYKNGPFIGGPLVSGEAGASAGTVRIIFDSPTSGKINMPVEGEKIIHRLQFFDVAERLSSMRKFDGYTRYANFLGLTYSGFDFTIENKKLVFKTRTVLGGTVENPRISDCTFTGDYTLAGKGLNSSGLYTCVDSETGTYSGTYLAKRFTVDRTGVFSGTLAKATGSSNKYSDAEHYYGLCVAPAVIGFAKMCMRELE